MKAHCDVLIQGAGIAGLTLAIALQRRGYKVIARTDDADRLIHVQIGPFTARKDAEATRQKLLGDGYNAFLK